MDKTAILCQVDSTVLNEFSRQSLARVANHSLLSAVLTFFSVYLEANVRKEVEKDQLIIREAAEAHASGRPACDLDLEDLFEKTKQVDKAFLDRLLIPPFSITVRYSDFSDIRIQRIWRIAKAVYALLDHWPDSGSFIDATRSAYSAKEFKEIIVSILHLYNLETRMLSDSIRSPFRAAIASHAETLYLAMEEVMTELVNSYIAEIYGNEVIHA